MRWNPTEVQAWIDWPSHKVTILQLLLPTKDVDITFYSEINNNNIYVTKVEALNTRLQ